MKKRYYGRVSRQLPAIVANEDGMRLKVMTVEAASDSVSILCNVHQRDVITPGGSFLRNGRPVKLSFAVDIPEDGGKTSKVMVQCHIAFSRRISKEKCLIGMRYIDFENNSEDRLLDFISRAMVSNDTESSAICA